MSTDDSWIAYAQERPGARLRLFCFHFAGGAASVFRNWQDELSDDVQVLPVQLPGREGRLREPLLQSLDDVVARLLEPVRARMDIPAVFFGHSMGGLIAFELTRTLSRLGKPLPLHLFVAGRRGPQTTCRFPDIHNLSHDDLLEAMRNYGGTPEAILNDAEMMELLLPIIRADFSVLETYRYKEEKLLDLPLSVYGGDQDVRATKDEMEAWRQETTGPFALRLFQAEHFFISTHRDEVIAALGSDLDQILATL